MLQQLIAKIVKVYLVVFTAMCYKNSHKLHMCAWQIVERAVANITPVLENRTARVRGGALQVPVEPSPIRARSMGIRWLVKEVLLMLH